MRRDEGQIVKKFHELFLRLCRNGDCLRNVRTLQSRRLSCSKYLKIPSTPLKIPKIVLKRTYASDGLWPETNIDMKLPSHLIRDPIPILIKCVKWLLCKQKKKRKNVNHSIFLNISKQSRNKSNFIVKNNTRLIQKRSSLDLNWKCYLERSLRQRPFFFTFAKNVFFSCTNQSNTN